MAYIYAPNDWKLEVLRKSCLNLLKMHLVKQKKT